MKTNEQDYPTRAEYAAALNWWEIMKITFWSGYCKKPVPRPDGCRSVKNWLIGFREIHTAKGKENWVPLIVYLGIVIMAFVLTWITGGMVGNWTLLWFGLVIIGLGIHVLSGVFCFRAGGWKEILEERYKKLAWDEQLGVLRGDLDKESKGGVRHRFGKRHS
jgi:hypothetical protein